MESTLGRRNIRSQYHSRRRRTHTEERSRISKILRQLIICAAVFIIVLTIKNIDSNFTNYISTKTSTVLTSDTQFADVLDQVKQIFSSLNITNEKLRAVFSSQGIIPSQDFAAIAGEMKDKVYDAELIKDKEFVPPLVGKLESAFGPRVSPISGQNEFHNGIDISGNAGDSIKAVLEGVVVEAKSDNALGNYLKIKHDDSVYSLYGHASELLVEKGQEVKKGDVIAKVGSTGASTGNHLHLQIFKGEKLVDPQKIFNYESKDVIQ